MRKIKQFSFWKKNPLLLRLSKYNSTFKDGFISGKQTNNLQEPYFQRKCILRQEWNVIWD